MDGGTGPGPAGCPRAPGGPASPIIIGCHGDVRLRRARRRAFPTAWACGLVMINFVEYLAAEPPRQSLRCAELRRAAGRTLRGGAFPKAAMRLGNNYYKKTRSPRANPHMHTCAHTPLPRGPRSPAQRAAAHTPYGCRPPPAQALPPRRRAGASDRRCAAAGYPPPTLPGGAAAPPPCPSPLPTRSERVATPGPCEDAGRRPSMPAFRAWRLPGRRPGGPPVAWPAVPSERSQKARRLPGSALAVTEPALRAH